MAPVTFLYLQQEDVKQCGGLDMAAYMESVSLAFSLFDKGEVQEPDGHAIHWGNPAGRRFLFHPAYVGGAIETAGIKWIPGNPENPQVRGLPRSHAITIINDTQSGYPLAVMDGSLISHMRTGAVAGVGVKHLARPGASVVGLIGAGPIARTQFWAIGLALGKQLERVQVFDLNPAAADRFIAAMSVRLGVDPSCFRVVDSAAAAASGADIIATATNVSFDQRYFKWEWLKPGALLINTSVRDPELEVVAKAALVVVDGPKQLRSNGTCLGEAVKAGLFKTEEAVTIGSIINGKYPGRRSDDEIILFSPMGMGIHDIANARRIYHEAKRQGMGITLKLWDEPEFI
jgi:2,3-diaminopropionate biosynthesis protein SbnB